jgi:hypothetical protein
LILIKKSSLDSSCRSALSTRASLSNLIVVDFVSTLGCVATDLWAKQHLSCQRPKIFLPYRADYQVTLSKLFSPLVARCVDKNASATSA